MMQTDPEPLRMQSEVEGAADRAAALMCFFLRLKSMTFAC